MERESLLEKYQWEMGKYPPPSQVLEAALSLIEPDGLVMFYDEEDDEWFADEPYEPVDIDSLPSDMYEKHLLSTARVIYARVSRIALSPDESEYTLRSLAKYLTAYRHDSEFLQRAISLGKVDEKGFLHGPRLPRRPPTKP